MLKLIERFKSKYYAFKICRRSYQPLDAHIYILVNVTSICIIRSVHIGVMPILQCILIRLT